MTSPPILTVERISARDSIEAIGMLLSEGAETLFGFDERGWWDSLADSKANSHRVLFGARLAGHSGWVGLVAAQSHPGRVAFVWPPVVLRAAQSNTDHVALLARHLLARLREWLTEQGTQVAQCLVEQRPAGGRTLRVDHTLEEVLLQAEFIHEVRLEMWERPVQTGTLHADEAHDAPESSEIEWWHFTAERRCLFEKVAGLTLVDSADCRFLAGRRTGADLLAAHAGRDPIPGPLWWLGRVSGQPFGILLMREEMSDEEDRLTVCAEISYLGVVPEWRGRGLGTRLIHRAIQVARRREAVLVRAAVDAANDYARKLYDSSGFAVSGSFRGRVRVTDLEPEAV